MANQVLTLLLLLNIFTTEVFAQKGQMRLLTYNIRNAKGMDNKVDYDRIAAVLKHSNADVIGLQEVDSATKRSEGVKVAEVLAKKTRMHVVYGAAIPYQGGRYGVAVLSKRAPLHSYTVPLPGREELRVLLVMEFKKYVIFNTHLSLTEADRMSSLAWINEQAAQFQKPIYLMGDFNAEPGSAFIKALERDWNRLSSEAPTFPAPEPIKCIDYVYSRNCRKKQLSANVIGEAMASDHRPVFVVIK
jgi:endonuclease/exonuclease/phosphatase family metal-dependent hydrolase